MISSAAGLGISLFLAIDTEAIDLKITDDLLQKDLVPFGINISQSGGGAPWGLRTDKIYFAENFEGTIYRQLHEGMLCPDGFITKYTTKKNYEKWWPKLNMEELVVKNANAMLVSGPAKGEKRVITGIEFADYTPYPGAKTESFMKFKFDKPVNLPDGKPIDKMGLLIERDNSKTEGCTGEVPGHWMSSNVQLVHDDLFPGGFGHSALMLDATKEQIKTDKEGNESPSGKFESFYMRGVGNSKYVDFNGRWIVKLKAKTLDKDAKLTLSDGGSAKAFKPIEIPVTGEWKKFTLNPEVSGKSVTENERETMNIVVTAKGGRVIIDDYTCSKDVRYENPTIFNDEFVNGLKFLKPGIIRQLMMGGTMEERLSPWIESVRSTNDLTKPAGPVSMRKACSWSLPDVYNLAEHLGTEVWCSIPGTLFPEEVDLFMEYIGGPAGTKGGDMRIRHGHPKPYTETLKKIHVEPGNEAWNTMFAFTAGGYNGPDYWEGIFSKIKKSPYYRNNIVCHAAGQNYSSSMTDRILQDTPSADEYAIAPYQIHGLSKEDMDTFKTDADFARFCMIYPMKSVETSMKKQMDAIRKFKKRFSVYEINWHMTGDDIDAQNKNPKYPEIREMVNRFVSSVPGASAHYNHMLRLVRDCNMRALNHFTMTGDYFNVKLWGCTLNMAKGQERYRPAGLAFGMINECIFGDMLKTEQSGDQPTISAMGGWPGNKKVEIPGKKGKKTEASETSMPAVHSYAFKDGKRHSLVLFNFDLEKSHQVKVSISGLPKSVVSKRLAPKSWLDNNEYDLGNGKNNVSVENVNIQDFGNGTEIILQPASVQTIIWEE